MYANMVYKKLWFKCLNKKVSNEMRGSGPKYKCFESAYIF